MKHWKSTALVAAAILFGFLVIGGLGQASAADVINWKFQSHHTPGALSTTFVIPPFIERVRERSGGRLNITLHYAGELVEYSEVFPVVNDNYTSPSTTITLPQTGTRRNYRSGALETRFCACFPDILSA